MIVTIAAHQVQSLRRRRVLAVFLGLVVAMTALAGAIGWSSHRTIVRVYNEAVTLLAAEGKTAPPNPFELKPSLSLLSNMVIYIPLIGALLAMIVGHLSVADDESSGLGRLIFSRRVSRSSYVAGKLAGTAVVIATVLAASLAVSVIALLVANGSLPGEGDLARLAGFYGLSWLYLMLFAVIGMVTVLVMSRRSLALLSALGIWLVITFVVPQVTSGLRPTTSLNPISDPAGTSEAFFRVTNRARPFSISEQYKTAGTQILQIGIGDTTAETLLRVLPIAGLLVCLAFLTAWLVGHHDYSRSTSDG
ncbi:MAG: ABC transporter permease [Acidimicrobiia bacterium]|nr:ABC transporter permease [Acidimicrobiia bacterium]